MPSSASLGAETGPAQAASNRAEVRKRCFMAATISFNKGLTTCECVIRNISEGGARIDVDSALSLPTFFHLYIPIQQRRLYAELKWRSESEAGIQFCNEGSSSEPVLFGSGADENAALKRRVRDLEAEVVRLQNRILQLTDGAV
jgi:hypothetical protein